MLRLDVLAVAVFGVRPRGRLLVRQASSVVITTEKGGEADVVLDLRLAFVVSGSKAGLAEDLICKGGSVTWTEWMGTVRGFLTHFLKGTTLGLWHEEEDPDDTDGGHDTKEDL